MEVINIPIFDIFKSNKENQSTQEEEEGTLEVSPEVETNDVEETEYRIVKKDNNSIEEVSHNNIKEKTIQNYTPHILLS